jgi:hypothetical protein
MRLKAMSRRLESNAEEWEIRRLLLLLVAAVAGILTVSVSSFSAPPARSDGWRTG